MTWNPAYNSESVLPVNQGPHSQQVFTTQFANNHNNNNNNSNNNIHNTSGLHGNGLTGQEAAPYHVGSPIKVRCRTPDGTQSPYLGSTNGPMQMDIGHLGSPVRTNNPYSFSMSGHNTPNQVGTPTQRFAVPQFAEVPSDVTYTHSSLDPRFQLPPDVAHRDLRGRCRFIPFPANLPQKETSDSAATSSCLFIGQVRFETTPSELAWVIQRTCGAVVSHFESRGAGCFIVHCRSSADAQLVRSLHKRVLFDVGGVWLARNPEEIDALCEYVALDAAVIARKSRLPKDSMVVEEIKTDAGTGGGGGGGGGGQQKNRNKATRPGGNNSNKRPPPDYQQSIGQHCGDPYNSGPGPYNSQ